MATCRHTNHVDHTLDVTFPDDDDEDDDVHSSTIVCNDDADFTAGSNERAMIITRLR